MMKRKKRACPSHSHARPCIGVALVPSVLHPCRAHCSSSAIRSNEKILFYTMTHLSVFYTDILVINGATWNVQRYLPMTLSADRDFFRCTHLQWLWGVVKVPRLPDVERLRYQLLGLLSRSMQQGAYQHTDLPVELCLLQRCIVLSHLLYLPYCIMLA